MEKKQFNFLIEEFITKQGISATSFGIKAIGESLFVFKLRKGRECREKTQQRVLDFMARWEAEHGAGAELSR
jgi:hypothetical protein